MNATFLPNSSSEHLGLVEVSKMTFEYPQHLHRELSIVTVLSGTEITTIGERKFVAGPGTTLLINPNEPHSSFSIQCHYRSLKVSPELISRIAGDMPGTGSGFRLLRPFIDDASIFSMFLSIQDDLIRSISPSDLETRVVSSLHRLIQHESIDSPQEFQSRKRSAGLQKAEEYLQTHFTESISLDDLAATAGLSKFHLLRSFRSKFGISPHEYRNQLRIALARRMLRSGLSIIKTALETGFCDQSHLARHFKRITTWAPGQYAVRYRPLSPNTSAISRYSNIVQ